MSLKLFRVTEFAESVFFTPESQRNAVHPATVVVLTALWLATVGNLALWQSLWQTLVLALPFAMDSLPGEANAAIASSRASLLALPVLLFVAVLVPVTLVCWRWTLKIGITLLLLAAALGTCILWQQQATGATAGVTPALLGQLVLGPDRNLGRFFNGECALTVLLVAVLPALLLWRIAVRRIPFTRNILMNAAFLIANYAIWTGATALTNPDFQEIIQKHRPDPSSINPVNTLLAVGELASKKIALP
jgi:lipid A ethanolaminephosphotransferase